MVRVQFRRCGAVLWINASCIPGGGQDLSPVEVVVVQPTLQDSLDRLQIAQATYGADSMWRSPQKLAVPVIVLGV